MNQSARMYASLTVSALSMSVVAGMAGLGGAAAGAATTPTAAAPTAFCTQVKASQVAIQKATGTTKLTAIAGEWTKIEKTAPAAVKSSVTIVRTAYETAAKAGNDTAVKAPAVATAGKAVTTYFSKSCAATGSTAGGAGGDRGPGGPDGDGGPGGAALEAYRACLTKNGVNAAAPAAPTGSAPAAGRTGGRGPGLGLDPSDPKVAKAMTACQSLLPQGFGQGFGQGGRGGGRINEALQACLKTKGVTLPQPGAGGQGAAGGQRPQMDAKTQAALEACRSAAPTATPTTVRKTTAA